MSYFTVIGYRKTEFDADDGKHISGYSIWFASDDSKCVGQRVDKFFFTDEKLGGLLPSPGEVVELRFNRYGKPDCICPV